MKKITDKDVEALKAGKKVTKGFIHMQLDDKGKLNLWSDINITDNYRSLKIDANKLPRSLAWSRWRSIAPWSRHRPGIVFIGAIGR